MFVGSSDRGMVLPQEDRVPGDHEALLREEHCIRGMAVVHRTASAAEIRAAVGTTVTQPTVRNWFLQGQLLARCPVVCTPLIPNHCRLRHQGWQPKAHW
ncbi:uncharacterized protein TNCV_3863301 [Trichonephila clavipes]|uniref:Transposase n=1 Tax=Trichonephila clavipes TaxID=2585209 RepID=A0A8X6S3Y6_TRICX|nr:uncharacterized protein TNCV_3863301 [Trichonephila clavipes]